MADGRSEEVNLNVEALKLVDPYIKEIIDTAKYVALYTFENEAWSKTKIQGSLFVYARTAEPLYNMLILNRLGKENWIEPITPQLDLQCNEPYLLYKNNVGKIFGIWFFEPAECARVNQLVQSLMHQAVLRPTHQVEPRNGPVDIFRMLTQAQEALSGQESGASSAPNSHVKAPPPPGHAGPTPNSVAEFFAKAGTGSSSGVGVEPARVARVSESEGGLAGLLQQLKVNPVHSVQHIEKQQRATTPLSADTGHTVDPLKQLMRPRSMEVDRRLLADSIGIGSPFASSSNGHPAPHNHTQPHIFSNGENAGRPFLSKTSSPPGFPALATEPAASAGGAVHPDLMPPAMFTPRDPTYLQPRACEAPALGWIGTDELCTVPTGESHRPLGVDSPEPLTRNQLLQALRYLMANDADFINKIHEAYVKSLTEKML